ncbi:hypothetical protein SAMN05421509_101303 [Chromohalobacter canadensis]|uniref:HEAT repeat-containing protein n=1 Tax=Chromohalobacter canadensis TaxID=141389 RepID=A0A285VBI9_9GAMM|nr:hypothetical protein [Chromohalobacter canadensis]SOC51449.1 hypothetical protein SAMN05421509_101303 [Chromohalobacter canadensis]
MNTFIEYEEDVDLNEAAAFVAKNLLAFDPLRFFELLVGNVKELYQERTWIRSFYPTDEVLEKVVGLVHDAVVSGRRYRTEPCLKLIKYLVKLRREDSALPAPIVDQLFDIFKRYVNCGKEEIEWCVSVYLKDSKLKKHQILWLIDNWELSRHVVNRLLLYPEEYCSIKNWARNLITKELLMDRRSELLALLVGEGVLDEVGDSNEIKLWAICKSRAPTSVKAELIEKHSDIEDYRTVIEIVDRIGEPSPLVTLLQKIDNKKANQSIEPTR